jgi:flagellar P-ring protein precursor FlgI
LKTFLKQDFPQVWVVCVLSALVSFDAFAIRLKDLATVRGSKENQVIGYGMVVGLPGTGDRGGDFTEGSLNTALKGLGVDPKTSRIASKNSAAVIVSGNLPAFSKVGSKFDITVASIASASSLEGGTLMMTPLKGADGKVYAVASGRIAVTKRSERGTSAFQAMLSAVIPDGAIIEKDVELDFANIKDLKYQLHAPDFTTAARIAQRINEELSGKYATAMDPGTVDVILPYGLAESPVDVVAKLESLEVEPDRKAKVVVNRKTGAVVLGDLVRVAPVSIAHNNLRIQIKDEMRQVAAEVENPEQVPSAVPAAPPRAPRQVTMPNRPPNIADVVTALNEVGANADDIIFVLQSMKNSGALAAELELQ